MPPRARVVVARGVVVACTAVACAVATATATATTVAAEGSMPEPIATPDDAATTPLRATFVAEDAARAYDIITYEGPSYDGCCPLATNGENGENGGDALGCCASGGCCPSAETTDAYGVYLACCTAQSGTMEENRARSRVWYAGPSYDGCCPNGDGLNMGCCASARGCCPSDGGERHACCPAMGAVNDGEVEIMDMRGDGESEYDDDDDDDAVEERNYDAQGIARRDAYEDATGAAGRFARDGLQDERASVDDDGMSTVYLQLAAVVCVVVWAAALVSNTMYAKFDGRAADDEREVEALLIRDQRRRGR